MTDRLKRSFPHIEVLDRNPGICYVNGISSLDMLELVSNEVVLVPHKDPMRLVEGQLVSRHKGMTFERLKFDISDQDFPAALHAIRSHFTIE